MGMTSNRRPILATTPSALFGSSSDSAVQPQPPAGIDQPSQIGAMGTQQATQPSTPASPQTAQQQPDFTAGLQGMPPLMANIMMLQRMRAAQSGGADSARMFTGAQ
jgi:hypothetical protein